MAEAAGSVSVEVRADLGKLAEGLQQAEQKTRTAAQAMQNSMTGAQRTFTAAGAAVGRTSDALAVSADKFAAAYRAAGGDLGRITPQMLGAASATSLVGQSASAANDNLTKFQRTAGATVAVVQQLRSVMAGMLALMAGSAIVRMTDAWTDLNSRLKIAVGGVDEGRAALARLTEMARRTYSDLNLTAESFLRNSTALKELGYSTQQQLDYTEALNNALVVSGAKGDRAASVMNALSRAMALGQLRGDELNTVLMSGDRVTKALAEGFGVASTELRRMGQEGKLTSDLVFRALISQMEVLRAEADSMPATIGDAFVLLRNAALAFVGSMDDATGASSRVSQGIIFLADNIADVARVAVTAAGGLAAMFAPAIIAAAGSLAVMIGVRLVGAVNALTAAVVRNPLGALAVAVATAVTAIIAFRDRLDSLPPVLAAVARGVLVLVDNFDKLVELTTDFVTAIGSLNFAAFGTRLLALVGLVEDASAGYDELARSVDRYAEAQDRAAKATRRGSEALGINLALAVRFFDTFGGTEALRQDLDKFLDAQRRASEEAVSAASAAAKAPADAADAQRKAVAAAITSLEFEQAQLGRTAREQAVYNAVKQAGVEVTSEYGQQVAAAAAKLYDMQKALEDTRASMGVFGSALEGIFTGAIRDADKLIDSISQGFAKIAAQKAVEGLIQAFDKLGTSIKGVGAALGGFGIGASTGSPLLGGLGGALSGFMTFGPIGAIIGGIGGLIGGLFGQSREERQRKEAQAATRLATAQEKLRAAYEAQRATIETRVLDAQNALRAAYEAQSSALRGTIAQMRSFIDGIRSFKDEIRLDQGVSPLSPQQRLAEARRQFESTAARARGGDAAAQANLTGAARTYLDEARSFFASSTAYAAIFDQVNAVLDRAAAGAAQQITAAQQQLAALNRQVGGLIDINNSVKTVAQAIRELRAAQAAEKRFELVTKQVSKLIDIDNSVKSVTAAINQLRNVVRRFGGSGSGSGADRRQAGGMIPAYAAGGMVGNGTFDLDSVRARYAGGGEILLAGGEGVISAPAARAIGSQSVDFINRSMRLPGGANDNAQLFDRLIRVSNINTRAQIDELREGFLSMVDAFDRLTRAVRTEPTRQPPLRRAGLAK